MKQKYSHVWRIGALRLYLAATLPLLTLALFSAADARAQVTFSGTQISLFNGTWSAPAGVAADGAGDVFISDKGNNRVVEISPSGGGFSTPVTILNGLSGPTGITSDWSGNLYISDTGNSRILMLPLTKSGFGSPVVAASGLNTPIGIAVDSADNIYVAVSGSNCIMEIPFVAGAYGTPLTVATGFNNPMGVAVDAARNLFVADTGNHRVVKEPYTAGGYSTQTTLWGTTITPVSIYVDKSNNVYFADSANRRVAEEPWATGAGRYNTQIILGSGFESPSGVIADSSGSVYVVDAANDQLMKLVTGSVPFGAISVGSSGSQLTYNFSIGAGTTLGSVSIYTQGVTGRDFVDAGQSTCVAQTYSTAAICGVNVNFKPIASGTRMGAVVLSNSSGSPLASIFTSGVGEESQAAFIPGSATTLGGQLSGPEGVAVDGNGDVYIADTGNNRVVELPWTGSGYGQQTTVPFTGLSSPMGVALDGAGNLYVASNGNDQVMRLAWTGNGFGAQSKTGTGLYGPSGVTADAAGNIYITDTLDERIDKVAWTGTGFGAEQELGSYHRSPDAIAVDGTGNVYFSDLYQSSISEVPWGGTSYLPQASVPQVQVTFPSAFAVDGNSNLYIADAARNQVIMLPRIGAGFGPQITIATGFNAPGGIAVDSSGNLYVADTGNNQVVKIQLSTPAVQSFSTTPVGATSADSAHVERVVNIGNQNLILTSLAFPSDFPEDAGAVSACTGTTLLESSQWCELAIDFVPKSVGSPLSESVTMTDNSFGVEETRHSVSLTGTSVARSAQAIALPSISNVAYGVAPLVLAATASSGLPVTLSVLSGPGKINYGDVLTVTGVGTIVVQATQAGNSLFEPAPTAQMSILVSPAILTVTPVNVTCVYRSVPTSFQYSITGFVHNENPSVATTGRAVVTSAASSNSTAGIYFISASPGTLASANYIFTFATGTLTINKAPIQVQAHSVSRTYGSPMQALTWSMSGFLSGDSSNVVTGAPMLSTQANSGSPVGVYPIVVSIGTLSAANYSFVAVGSTITVHPAILTVSATPLAVIYGTPIPALSYTISGFMNGDTPSSVVNGTPLLTTSANSHSGAGSYAIQPSMGTLTSTNYSFTFATGILSVNKATVVVTASNASSTYGSSPPALTCSMIGFVNGDTAATAIQGSPNMTASANAKSPPGKYAIVASLGSLVSKNYTFVFANGVLTVGKAELIVTPKALSMTYGGQLPALTYSFSGFVNGDGAAALTGAPNLSTTGKANSPVGEYPITAAPGTLAASNYSFQFASATLTVTKAILTVKANNLSVILGNALPPLTYSVSGLVNGDTQESAATGLPVLTTTATTSKTGTYVIAATTGTMAAVNYQLVTQNGTLTVTPLPTLYRITSSIASSDSEYGARNTPRSVMMAVTYFAGVTSNAGLQMPTPCGVSCLPPWWVTSTALRSSIGIASPVAVARSMVDHGAAT
jgi:sugar lactone lactonase YvrE